MLEYKFITMKTFRINTKICSDFNGYNHLSTLNHKLKQLTSEQIQLDFSDNTWFEANLCAVLGAILYEAAQDFNDISIINLPPAQQDIFSRNHFLA